MGCPTDVAMMSYHGDVRQMTDWTPNIHMASHSNALDSFKTMIYLKYYEIIPNQEYILYSGKLWWGF